MATKSKSTDPVEILNEIADIEPGPSRTAPYNYTTKPDDRAVNLTDLDLIGVPVTNQGSKPTVQAFPRKFNTQSQKIWATLIVSKSYMAKVRVWGSLDLIWHNTIQEFLALCEKVGVFPFDNSLAVPKNDVIIEAVRRARIAIVKYANRCGFFTRVRVRKAFRDYVRTDSGFTIISWADLYPLEDTDDFETWIQTAPMPRMLKRVDNRYMRVIQPGVRMWVRYINRSRVRIGFEIDIVGNVIVPNNDGLLTELPSNAQVDAYLDKYVLFPIIRSHRFKDVRTRLF